MTHEQEEAEKAWIYRSFELTHGERFTQGIREFKSALAKDIEKEIKLLEGKLMSTSFEISEALILAELKGIKRILKRISTLKPETL